MTDLSGVPFGGCQLGGSNMIEGDVMIEGGVSVDCFIVSEPLVGCLNDECVTGFRRVLVYKDGVTPSQILESTLPVGATEGPCDEVITITAAVPCRDKRIMIDTPATHNIPALLGASVGDTITDIAITVQNLGDKEVLPVISDSDGNASMLLCGESLRLTGGAADYTSTFQSITTNVDDRVTIEARVCPPTEV